MKNIIITGGAHGIGKAIAERFLADGDKVIIIDLDQNAGERLAAQHEHLSFFHGDIAEQTTLDKFLSELTEPIHLLVNNAMLSKKGLLSNCSYEDFEYTQRIGVTAPYYLTSQLYHKQLFAPAASVINLASSRAFQSQSDTESYSAAKGGIVALTHALAVSLAPHVRVNCISPGWIETDAQAVHSTADDLQQPAGRVGKPADIAHLVHFLAQDEASFITGENIMVDGGMSKLMIYHNDEGWTLDKS